MFLHSTSTKEIYGTQEENAYNMGDAATDDSIESINVTSNGRGSWHHVSLDNRGKVFENHLKEIRSSYLSSTLLMKLTPFEDTMNDYQTTVYQNGLKNFLVAQFGKDDNYHLQIKDVSVVRNKIAMVADRQEIFTAEDHVLHVKSIVLAEPGTESSRLSSEDFSNIVVRYCNQFSDNLIFSWQAEENDTIDRGDDRFEDSIAFGQIFNIESEAVLQARGDGDGRHGKSGNKNIAMLAASLAVLFVSVFFIYRYYKIRK